MIYYLQLYDTDIAGAIIIFLPFVVFFITYSSLPCVEENVHEEVGQETFITVGLLVVAIIMTWFERNPKNFYKILTIMLVSIILLVISLIEVWADYNTRIIFKHIRTGLQTLALVLFAYAIYKFLYDVYDCIHVPNCADSLKIPEADRTNPRDILI